jgi:hypothetical protein
VKGFETASIPGRFKSGTRQHCAVFCRNYAFTRAHTITLINGGGCSVHQWEFKNSGSILRLLTLRIYRIRLTSKIWDTKLGLKWTYSAGFKLSPWFVNEEAWFLQDHDDSGSDDLTL